ncbi:unnamed protein product [Adineta steineri]|uniref:Uncharacterized protein n=1 Tax=Adineta steineri TaxID=433720 RepID=A0A814H022_9BILA|nr:unnamed protein product [Adineta steineri]CAF1110180.1 unnamed protein product [Adineta steineri]
MQTIDNIRFNHSIYLPGDNWITLLHDISGVHIPIMLPNAHLITFVEAFRSTATCSQRIQNNTNKNVTLFAYEDNLNWLIANGSANRLPHLHKVHIFCSSTDKQQFWKSWMQRYRDRFEEPFLANDLDYQLLLIGDRHIDILKQQFIDVESVQNHLIQDQRAICQALATHFLNKVNAEDERIRFSEEARE